MNRQLLISLKFLVAGLTASFAGVTRAEVYINEIYFNPPNAPSALDLTSEYIELRGTPSMSLANHYLIFVDSMANGPPFNGGPAGLIEHIFNLNSRSLGTNGYLTIRQKGNGYAVAAGTTSLVNSGSGAGFGSGATSSIGASDLNNNGVISSGFTAMLIRNDSGVAPTLGFDLDVGNNGLDVATGRPGWTILDSIGFTEPSEAYTARYYGKVNFGPEFPDLNPQSLTYFDPAAHMEPGATYTGTGFELEYFARWGNSTGQTAADWHVAGLTDNTGSGFQAGTWNYRQSTDQAHPAPNAVNLPPSPMPSTVTSTQGVPYGTIITNTLGAPNFLIGDYNKNGVVDASDYVVWRKRIGQTGSDIADHPADGNHDYVVGSADYPVWIAHFGQPSSNGSPGSASDSSMGEVSSTIPEPAGWVLAALAWLEALQLRKQRVV